MPRKLRILTLHGGMSCAKKFKSGTMKKVIRSMRDAVDFEFVDAPFMTRCPVSFSSDDTNIPVYYDETLSQDKRSWWNWNNNDPKDSRYGFCGYHQEGLFYHGFDDSLALLHRTWNSAAAAGSPFDGIFGFSQGAITASIFAHWMLSNEEDASHHPKFMVLVSGFLKPVPLNYPEYWTDNSTLRNSLRDTYETILSCDNVSYDDFEYKTTFEKINLNGYDPSDQTTAI